MTNEELAILAKDGDVQYITQLWLQVENFIKMQSGKWFDKIKIHSYDKEDLIQSGYFALLAAIKYYDPEKNFTFLTYLSKTLLKEFYAVAGKRTSKKDLIVNSTRLDDPINDTTDLTILNLIPDARSEFEHDNVLNAEFIAYADSIILSSLSAVLKEKSKQLICAIYFGNMSLTQAAEVSGYNSKQSAGCQHYAAMLKLRYSCFAPKLKELLNDFSEFDISAEAMQSVGIHRFCETQISATERTALKYIDYMEMKSK